jgi:hypothetical protein
MRPSRALAGEHPCPTLKGSHIQTAHRSRIRNAANASAASRPFGMA